MSQVTLTRTRPRPGHPLLQLCGFATALLLAACAPRPASSTHLATSAAGRSGGPEAPSPWSASDWIVEQRPGGVVRFEPGRLVIEDKEGCTVWLRRKLEAPVRISYTARLSRGDLPANRISDLNCFWMSTDPGAEDGLAVGGAPRRSGAFADYDRLRCYYVGIGGNHNTSTRFRRYAGDGSRPLLPEHDLSGPEVLLEADRDYRIVIESTREGIRFSRDGVTLFDWRDPAPLLQGHFGFRTVWSRLEIRDFRVEQLP